MTNGRLGFLTCCRLHVKQPLPVFSEVAPGMQIPGLQEGEGKEASPEPWDQVRIRGHESQKEGERAGSFAKGRHCTPRKGSQIHTSEKVKGQILLLNNNNRKALDRWEWQMTGLGVPQRGNRFLGLTVTEAEIVLCSGTLPLMGFRPWGDGDQEQRWREDQGCSRGDPVGGGCYGNTEAQTGGRKPTPAFDL